MQYLLVRFVLPVVIAWPAAGQLSGPGGWWGFSTNGHTIYHLRPATVQAGGARALIAAAYDGAVLCYTPQGKRIWEAATGGHLPFDLAAADIDSDGLDEALVASADGTLYAIDHDGRLLWKFATPAPLFQVAVARREDASALIVAGGVEQILYTLSPRGEVIHTIKTVHAIRHVRAGDIQGAGREQVAVATSSAGLSGILSLMLIDPDSGRTLWRKTRLGSHVPNSGRRFFSMVIADLDHDGKQDILLSNSWGENGKIFAFDGTGKEMFTASDKRIPNISYRMNLLSHVRLPDDEFVLGLFANVLIVYNRDGSCRQVLSNRNDFANAAYDESTRTYYLGSSTAGGDGIYALRLDQPGWQENFQRIAPLGKLARIESNLEQLKRQVAQFRPPDYQPPPSRATVLARKPEDRSYRNLRFVEQMTLSQKFDQCEQLWCRQTDRRQRYNLTADEIVAIAREREAAGRDFVIWSGHGHAAYMPLSTMERILEAAPKHFYGFVFAEMEGVDQAMQELVREIILPLAEACRRHGGRKIVFRNKNIFYNGTVYLPFWREVFLNERFRQVLVPALEETNSRTPELSLAGRIGFWMTGAFDNWACRVVTDNACWDRMWEWSSQQSQGHHLRHLISNAALGAQVFFNNIHQGPFSRDLEQQLTPFYDMLEKGIIHIPAREELLSVSGLALAMTSPPSPLYLSHGINGHAYRYPDDDHSPLVFDRLDTYWGAAPLLPHDFSRYAMNIRRRVSNFLPELPYGMVTMIPDDAGSAAGRFSRRITTDGRYFYDEQGQQRGAMEYKPVVEAALRQAAAKLPVVVNGEVHWSAARLDARHIRLTLVDPGYLDPADREAEVVFQHVTPNAVTDILSGQRLPLRGNRVRIGVPMGVARIVDVEIQGGIAGSR